MAKPIPDYGWQAVNLTSNSPTLVGEAMTLRRHRRALPAHRWQMEFTTPPLDTAEQRKFFTFITLLKGQIGIFDFVHPIYSNPIGTIKPTSSNTPIKTSVPPTAGTAEIAITGGVSGTTLEPGDLLKLGGHSKVYQVKEKATFDASNNANVKLNQKIVRGSKVNVEIEYKDVPFTLSLTEDEITVEIDGANGPLVEFTIVAVEDF